MTQQQAVDLLRELRDLERAELAIRRMETVAPEWQAVLNAIKWLSLSNRYHLSLEDPQLLDAASDILAGEKLAAVPTVDIDQPTSTLADLKVQGRIH